MNGNRIINISWSTIIPLLCLFCILAWTNYTDPLKDAPEAGYGHPALSYGYPDLDIGILQVMDDGSRIYVLSSSGNRIVQIYDMGGKYEKTVFFQRMSNNGMFTIATEKNTLFVRDEKRNVYIFSGGEFDRFLKEDEVQKELRHIAFQSGISQSGYVVKNGSVWRVSELESVCVIEGKTVQSQIIATGLFIGFWFALMGVTLYLKSQGK